MLGSIFGFIFFLITALLYGAAEPLQGAPYKFYDDDDENYHLRPRAHSQQLPQHTGHLTDSNFITRMLFTDIY